MQSTFSAIGTSIFQLSSFLLAWEWFPPAKRGLISGVVYSFQALAMAFIIGLQILIVEYKELAPIQNLEIGDNDRFRTRRQRGVNNAALRKTFFREEGINAFFRGSVFMIMNRGGG